MRYPRAQTLLWSSTPAQEHAQTTLQCTMWQKGASSENRFHFQLEWRNIFWDVELNGITPRNGSFLHSTALVGAMMNPLRGFRHGFLCELCLGFLRHRRKHTGLVAVDGCRRKAPLRNGSARDSRGFRSRAHLVPPRLKFASDNVVTGPN